MNVQEKYNICFTGLKDFAHKTHFSQALIGLSGGIDSSVVAALCVDVFGRDKVHGVIMPGPYSSASSVEDAQQLAQNLGIEVRTVSICSAFEAFQKEMGSVYPETLEGLAAENTQARCRMIVLMALSNANGWMLVNTGNKSESYMGYSTLYGDTAGVYAPLSCLYKSDVYALARFINNRAQERGHIPPIPNNVLIKPPSAELSDNQEDEKSLGCSYDTIDTILKAYFEYGMPIESICSQDIDLSTVERIVQRARYYEFKRAQEPPYPQQKIYDINDV